MLLQAGLTLEAVTVKHAPQKPEDPLLNEAVGKPEVDVVDHNTTTRAGARVEGVWACNRGLHPCYWGENMEWDLKARSL